MPGDRAPPDRTDTLVQALGQANAGFYSAFRSGDPAAMEAVWSRHDDIACLHPGVAPLVGREAVIGSWRAILAGPVEIAFRARHAAFVGAGAGLVVGVEILAEAELAVTNLFRLEDGVWRLVLHQGGGLTPPTAVPDGAVVH